jgi:hypothetical protein
MRLSIPAPHITSASISTRSEPVHAHGPRHLRQDELNQLRAERLRSGLTDPLRALNKRLIALGIARLLFANWRGAAELHPPPEKQGFYPLWSTNLAFHGDPLRMQQP